MKIRDPIRGIIGAHSQLPRVDPSQRSLTGSTGAAAVAGAVFALYPLRWAFYSNLELEITLWMRLDRILR